MVLIIDVIQTLVDEFELNAIDIDTLDSTWPCF